MIRVSGWRIRIRILLGDEQSVHYIVLGALKFKIIKPLSGLQDVQ